jgi:hypothetical protein
MKAKAGLNTITGGTGNAIVDGSMRGVTTMVALGLLAFANDKSDWLTDADLVNLTPVVAGAVLFLWGVWDGFIKPRLV